MVRRKKGKAAGFPQATSSPFGGGGGSGADPSAGFSGLDVLSDAPEPGSGGGGAGGININIVNQAVATAINESGPGGVTTGPVTGGGGGSMMMAPMMPPPMMGSSASPYKGY